MKNHLENSDHSGLTGRVIWRSGTPTHRLSAAPPSRALHHLDMASERRIATLAEQMRWLHTCADLGCNGMHDCASGATGGVAAAGVAGDDHEALEEGAVLNRAPQTRPASRHTPPPAHVGCPSTACSAGQARAVVVALSVSHRMLMLRRLAVDFEKLSKVVATESSVVPCCVQHADTKEVLIIAYVNDEALSKSRETKVSCPPSLTALISPAAMTLLLCRCRSRRSGRRLATSSG